MPIAEYLARSAATQPFRAAVGEFLRTAQPQPLLSFEPRCPPVKVERTVTRLLETYPELAIERVTLRATSGCEFFRGTATVEACDRTFRLEFEWNCRWKAQQLEWTDWFGLPDQARAAREFGHDCFRIWRAVPLDASRAA